MFFCVDMTFNWFQMLFRVFCIVSVQDLYALEQFQSTRQQQQLRETQVEIDLGAQLLLNYILVLIYKIYTRCSRVKRIGLWSASNALILNQMGE